MLYGDVKLSRNKQKQVEISAKAIASDWIALPKQERPEPNPGWDAWENWIADCSYEEALRWFATIHDLSERKEAIYWTFRETVEARALELIRWHLSRHIEIPVGLT